MDWLQKKYYQLIAVLFVDINNFIPSKMYGRFIGLSKNFMALFAVLSINLFEKIIVFLVKGRFFIKNEFPNRNLYFFIFFLLLLSQVFFSSDPNKYFEIEKSLVKQGVSKKVSRIFWPTLLFLIFFALYHFKKIYGKG